MPTIQRFRLFDMPRFESPYHQFSCAVRREDLPVRTWESFDHRPSHGIQSGLAETTMYCSNCGAQSDGQQPFCSKCGRGLTSGSAGAAQVSLKDAGLGVLKKASEDESGLLKGAVVFIVCACISALGWYPLAIPALLAGSLIPTGECSNLQPGTLPMYFCSAGVAARVLLGPILVGIILFLVRSRIARLVADVSRKVRAEARFLVGPVVATVLFTFSWAAIHFHTSFDIGILPQPVFPALIGLFMFASVRFGPSVQSRWAPFFAAREKWHIFFRYLAAFLVPLVLSLLITFQSVVTMSALKEQFIVLVALCVGYLALAPRHVYQPSPGDK